MTTAAGLLDPIPGDEPCGADARYDPSYEQIRAEVAKLDSARGQRIDWARVSRLSEPILFNKSKDLLLLCYCTAARASEGPETFEPAIRELAAFVEQFSEGLHPRRGKARANAVVWIAELLQNIVSQWKLDAAKGDALLASVSLAREAVKVFGEEAELAWGDLAQAIRRQTSSKLAESLEPKPDSPKLDTPGRLDEGDHGLKVEAKTAPDDGADLPQVLKNAGKQLSRLARALSKRDPTEPRVIRALRAGAFLGVDGMPSANEQGVTSLPSPPANLVASVKQMIEAKRWEALLDESESHLLRYRFWFDLHHASFLALEGLDKGAAADEVEFAARDLLRRYPSITTLHFSDGTPLAGEEAAAWASVQTATKNPPDNRSPRPRTPPKGEDPEPKEEHLIRYEKLREAGDFKEAIRVLRCAELRISGRARFILQMHIAATLQEAGQARAAQAVLALLDQEVQKRRLGEWDPELASALIQAYLASSVEGAQLAPELVDNLSCRLAQCDPEAALEFPTEAFLTSACASAQLG